MTVDMRTLTQLGQNSPPNPWKQQWVFWHYTDNYHYYALEDKWLSERKEG